MKTSSTANLFVLYKSTGNLFLNMIDKLKKIEYWLAALFVPLIIYGIPYSYEQTSSVLGGFDAKSNIYDKSFIEGIRNITDSVPKNESLLVSAAPTVIKHFSGIQAKTPYRVDSVETLEQYMKNNTYTYMLIVEGRATGNSGEALKPIFSKRGLPQLDPYFQIMETIKTEFATLHLYKIRH